eukprot:TRINITY_DN8861_c0_g1_i5.p1 TRINITY_DN8861_c0_g1~~TRINITY_DN8861_c0_g1_i5.p1  ORF type:complete len:362 (-),score=40.76 TRINITY_DN8861_c0_g1_i5:1106-2191(-)
MSRMSCLAEVSLVGIWAGVFLCILFQLSNYMRYNTVDLYIKNQLESKQHVTYFMHNSSSQVHGLQTKEDVPISIAWHKDYDTQRREEAIKWMNEGGIGIQPPTADRFPCGAFVSHQYRIVFVKQLMTFSDDFFGEVLGGECELGTQTSRASGCMERMIYLNDEEARKSWQDYFVFTVVRNPWVRALETYKMLQRTGFLNESDLSCYTKRENFCKHPQNVVKVCTERPKCCEQHVDNVGVLLHRQSSCLHNFEGKLTIDFIARAEHLEDDLNVAIDHINEKYRLPTTPKLRKLTPGEFSQKADDLDLGFHKKDQCIRDIAWHYQDDINFFGLHDVVELKSVTQNTPLSQKMDEMVWWLSQFG